MELTVCGDQWWAHTAQEPKRLFPVRVKGCQGTSSRVKGAGAECSLIMGVMSLRVRAPWIPGGREQAGSKVWDWMVLGCVSVTAWKPWGLEYSEWGGRGQAVTNCHKCRGLKQHRFFLNFTIVEFRSPVQISHLKSRCWKAIFFSGGSSVDSISAYFSC